MKTRNTLTCLTAVVLAFMGLAALGADATAWSGGNIEQKDKSTSDTRMWPATVTPFEGTALQRTLNTYSRGVVGLNQSGTVDIENRFPNVGAVMVFAGPNPFGIPEGLIGFASGTLIDEQVFLTAGHFTGPAKLGVPPFIHVFVSLNFNALDPSTWIPVETQITHPSLPPCPPPVGCDPTSTNAFQAGDPNIVDLGLVFLSRPVTDVEPAELVTPATLETPRVAGAPMTFVGYGFPEPRGTRPFSDWDGLRRFKVSTLDTVLNDVWASWSLPGVVCSGDSGGATFFNDDAQVSDKHTKVVAVASDGGLDCASKDIRVRLDSPAVQKWIRETIKDQLQKDW